MRFAFMITTFLLIGCSSIQADSSCPAHMAKLFISRDELDTNPAELRVEIANTDEARRTGLMHRREMPGHHGMLFTWPDRRGGRYFWMKNTYMALDMIFIDEGKIVAIIENATPHDETSRGTEQLVDAVLEVNAGWTRRNNVNIGDVVRAEDCVKNAR